jgi:hypothetical protein
VAVDAPCSHNGSSIVGRFGARERSITLVAENMLTSLTAPIKWTDLCKLNEETSQLTEELERW